MWRIVSIGPGSRELPRRVTDRGPLHPDKERVERIANDLRTTGLYESVTVVGTAVGAVSLATSDDPSADG